MTRSVLPVLSWIGYDLPTEARFRPSVPPPSPLLNHEESWCLTRSTPAAGYDLSTEAGFKSLMTDFESILGLRRLRAVHLNDSKSEHHPSVPLLPRKSPAMGLGSSERLLQSLLASCLRLKVSGCGWRENLQPICTPPKPCTSPTYTPSEWRPEFSLSL